MNSTANVPPQNLPQSFDNARTLSKLNVIRLVLAILTTVTFLPYAWGFTLVVYSKWGQIDRNYVLQLLGGLVGVIALNWGLASKLPSRRAANLVLTLVLVLWTSVIAVLLALRNGTTLPGWVVFAGFYPASLWVIWTGWMFFAPFRWFVRLGVLVLAIAAVAPYVLLFDARDLTGDANVNFAFRSSRKPETATLSGVGEISGAGIKLVANPATDFPGFQGAQRNAVIPAINLEHDWKSHPPREVWRQPVGAGWGGFAVVGNYALTQEQRGDDECVVCRELSAGREEWVHKDQARYNGKPRYEGMGGPGPRCTPAIDGGCVYSVGATGILNCLDGGTGHVRWTTNIVKDYEGSVAGHGVCGSPLIFKDSVIVAPTGKPQSSLAAYDKLTGKKLWVAGRDAATGDSAGYASPILASVGTTRQILNYSSRGVTGHEPERGTVLWHYDWTNDQDVVCSEPVPNAGGPNLVLLTVGYGKGSVLLNVSSNYEGTWSATPLWTSRNMKTKFTTAVVYGGCVYGLDDGILQCVDLDGGRQRWKGGRYGHGQILLTGDLLLVQSEAGPVVLVELNPERLVERGKISALSSKTWNGPALAGRRLLVRNDNEAACYELAVRTFLPK